MDTVLAGMPHVATYLDDILIASESIEEHERMLAEVLSRLAKSGLRVQAEKCEFFKESLEFLGHRIDAKGIYPSKVKVEAIHQAPAPKNKKELQAFLGMINFYNRFLKGRTEVAEKLYRLLDSHVAWNWGAEHMEAFENLKKLLTSNSLLVHFKTDVPLVLSCDASSVGVGAVLAHRDSKGNEQPVAYASRTLSRAERNYAQIDREALAVVFGVRHFHQYLCGRDFRIITDHKPLLGIFQRQKQIPAVISPRMLRWTLMLSAYDYVIEYRKTKDHGNADCLSRLPGPLTRQETEAPGDILLLEAVEYPPVSAMEVAAFTRGDPLLYQVKQWILEGWPRERVALKHSAYWGTAAVHVTARHVNWTPTKLAPPPTVLVFPATALISQRRRVNIKDLPLISGGHSTVWKNNRRHQISSIVRAAEDMMNTHERGGIEGAPGFVRREDTATASARSLRKGVADLLAFCFGYFMNTINDPVVFMAERHLPLSATVTRDMWELLLEFSGKWNLHLSRQGTAAVHVTARHVNWTPTKLAPPPTVLVSPATALISQRRRVNIKDLPLISGGHSTVWKNNRRHQISSIVRAAEDMMNTHERGGIEGAPGFVRREDTATASARSLRKGVADLLAFCFGYFMNTINDPVVFMAERHLPLSATVTRDMWELLLEFSGKWNLHLLRQGTAAVHVTARHVNWTRTKLAPPPTVLVFPATALISQRRRVNIKDLPLISGGHSTVWKNNRRHQISSIVRAAEDMMNTHERGGIEGAPGFVRREDTATASAPSLRKVVADLLAFCFGYFMNTINDPVVFMAERHLPLSATVTRDMWELLLEFSGKWNLHLSRQVTSGSRWNADSYVNVLRAPTRRASSPNSWMNLMYIQWWLQQHDVTNVIKAKSVLSHTWSVHNARTASEEYFTFPLYHTDLLPSALK
ncbi:hypothetical protein V5799_007587 [Amblyomma americanum]|uniref:Reverse transcriptase domain-containing protein n=1 Tax=Amblyomma americanum TaxID=6943 RepID=A0AAQ4FHI5_AMBAM